MRQSRRSARRRAPFGKHLRAKGPLSLTKLIKETEAPREMVLQAIGWLAREDKLVFEEGRTKTIGLKDC